MSAATVTVCTVSPISHSVRYRYASCIQNVYIKLPNASYSSKHELFSIQAEAEKVQEATMSEVEIWNGKNRLQTQVGYRAETFSCIISALLAFPSIPDEDRSFDGKAVAVGA